MIAALGRGERRFDEATLPDDTGQNQSEVSDASRFSCDTPERIKVRGVDKYSENIIPV